MLIKGRNKWTHTYFGVGLCASLPSSFLSCYGDAEMTVTSPCPQGTYALVSVVTWDCSGPHWPRGGRGLPWPTAVRARRGRRGALGWDPRYRVFSEWVSLVPSAVPFPALGFEVTLPCDIKHQKICFELKQKSCFGIRINRCFPSPTFFITFFSLVFGVHRITACTSLSLPLLQKMLRPNQSLIFQTTESF